MRANKIYSILFFFGFVLCTTGQENSISKSSARWFNPFPKGELGKTYTITPTDLPYGQKLFEVQKNKIKVLYSWNEKEASFGMITTNEMYSYYNLELEYKWGERKFEPRLEVKRDAGFVFHVQGEKVIWPTCLECQIQQGDTGDLWVIKGHKVTWIQKDGSEKFIDSSVQPDYKEGDKYANYEVAGWNKVRLEVRGSEGAKFFENGQLVNEIKTLLDSNDNLLEKGNIALQAEGSEIIYRNVRIQEIQKGD